MSKSRDLGEFPAAALDIDASGNLDVTGTVTADGLTVETATGTATPTPSKITIATSSSASDWSLTDPWGRLAFYSGDSSGSGGKPHIVLDATATNAIGASSSFSVSTTSESSNTLTKRFTINNEGNVGIGTSSPTNYTPFGYGSSVEVSGGTGGSLIVSDSGQANKTVLTNYSNTGEGILKTLTNKSLHFATNDNSPQMTLSSSGNVGIGTSSPVNNTNRSTLALEGAWGGQLDIMVGSTVHAQFGTDNFSSGQSARIQSRDGIVFKTNGATEAMRIDSAGRVTTPYQPSFRAVLNPGGPTPYVAGQRVLNFAEVDHNVGNHYNGTSKFTAPISGLYSFTCDRSLNTKGADQAIRHPGLSFLVNSSSVHNVNCAIASNAVLTSSQYMHFVVNMSTEIYLSAGDFVEVEFNYDGQPSILYEYGLNFFSGYLIG
ncbi:hypothetical protein OAA60_00930 [Porticoccaceae bacterium]|nr:hypothetical protein [Porticoccaceae bacterium]